MVIRIDSVAMYANGRSSAERFLQNRNLQPPYVQFWKRAGSSSLASGIFSWVESMRPFEPCPYPACERFSHSQQTPRRHKPTTLTKVHEMKQHHTRDDVCLNKSQAHPRLAVLTYMVVVTRSCEWSS